MTERGRRVAFVVAAVVILGATLLLTSLARRGGGAPEPVRVDGVAPPRRAVIVGGAVAARSATSARTAVRSPARTTTEIATTPSRSLLPVNTAQRHAERDPGPVLATARALLEAQLRWEAGDRLRSTRLTIRHLATVPVARLVLAGGVHATPGGFRPEAETVRAVDLADTQRGRDLVVVATVGRGNVVRSQRLTLSGRERSWRIVRLG